MAKGYRPTKLSERFISCKENEKFVIERQEIEINSLRSTAVYWGRKIGVKFKVKKLNHDQYQVTNCGQIKPKMRKKYIEGKQVWIEDSRPNPYGKRTRPSYEAWEAKGLEKQSRAPYLQYLYDENGKLIEGVKEPLHITDLVSSQARPEPAAWAASEPREAEQELATPSGWRPSGTSDTVWRPGPEYVDSNGNIWPWPV